LGSVVDVLAVAHGKASQIKGMDGINGDIPRLATIITPETLTQGWHMLQTKLPDVARRVTNFIPVGYRNDVPAFLSQSLQIFRDPQHPTLVHGDFWTGNIFVDPEMNVTVIDWQHSHWGIGEMDLATIVWEVYRRGVEDPTSVEKELVKAYQRLRNEAGDASYTMDSARRGYSIGSYFAFLHLVKCSKDEENYNSEYNWLEILWNTMCTHWENGAISSPSITLEEYYRPCMKAKRARSSSYYTPKSPSALMSPKYSGVSGEGSVREVTSLGLPISAMTLSPKESERSKEQRSVEKRRRCRVRRRRLTSLSAECDEL